MKKKTWEYMGR